MWLFGISELALAGVGAEVRFGILVGVYVVGGCAGEQAIESVNVYELMSEEMMQTGERIKQTVVQLVSH